jgi:hypothetical protein
MSKYKLSKKALEYVPKPISKEYCENILVDMILNNMKIEGQEVLKEDYLKFRSEMKLQESQRGSTESHE